MNLSELNSGETDFGESSIKRMRLNDDSDVLLSLSSSSSTPLAYTASDSEEDDHRSSACSSSETTNGNLPIEAHQISETETNNFRKQETPETAEMDTATTEKRNQQNQEEKQKSPIEDELEEFFSETERYEQKRFTEKYNYDIVNDTPLEGRYEWIKLKP